MENVPTHKRGIVLARGTRRRFFRVALKTARDEAHLAAKCNEILLDSEGLCTMEAKYVVLYIDSRRG